ncbi:MAG TPA: isoprenylcysteine carboxylmethyltransferase family protein [Terracidiphilus sp.]|nr:isoprenylcysteine carboxylmethyltransferase family protein [Terracidiphilus sp.]
MAAQKNTLWMGLMIAFFQFALAVLAWGGFKSFFSHPAFIALVVVTLAMMAVAPFSRGSLSAGAKEDRGNRWVLSVFTVIAILNAYFPPLTDRLNFLTMDGDTLRWAGIVLYAAGGALRLYPVFVLGKRFSGLVAIQTGHTLETHSIYSLIRNPSYLGMIINLIGWQFIFRSSIGLVLVLALFLTLIARMNAEERLLREHFGAEYDEYFARTWRLIPWIY